MGKNTFAYCSALKDVDWTAFAGTEVPEMSKTFFMGIDDLKAVTLSLKYEAYKLFSADEDWSELNHGTGEGDGLRSGRFGYPVEPEEGRDGYVDWRMG